MPLVAALIPVVITALAQLGAMTFIGWSIWQDPEPARRTVNQVLGAVGDATQGAGQAVSGVGEGIQKAGPLLPVLGLGAIVIFLSGRRH